MSSIFQNDSKVKKKKSEKRRKKKKNPQITQFQKKVTRNKTLGTDLGKIKGMYIYVYFSSTYRKPEDLKKYQISIKNQKARKYVYHVSKAQAFKQNAACITGNKYARGYSGGKHFLKRKRTAQEKQ